MKRNPPVLKPHTPIVGQRAAVGGLWGERLAASVGRWMLKVDEDVLLDGFRRRPGAQAWIGEHAGKWLCGAIGAVRYDLGAARRAPGAVLREKIDRVAQGLMSCQEADGYLGTYLPEHRWLERRDIPGAKGCDWDLWVHKYCMLGLLAYHDLTGSEAALATCRRIGDMIARLFVDEKRDINQTDHHAGLASGSILEPMALLYQRTGEPRHLAFARKLVEDFWQRPEGPRIIPVLRERQPLCRIGRGKAYEMLSCLVGLAEYCRATGDRERLAMLLDARDRTADTMRYPTGGMSSAEFFLPPGVLPERAFIETCVTFTWIQLNLRLYELTGDERALDLAEEAGWNQLIAALAPDGSTWTYHLPLTGPKRFARRWLQGVTEGAKGAPLSCCHTNGERGLSLVPRYACAESGGTVFVNFYTDGKVHGTLRGKPFSIAQKTRFARDFTVSLRVAQPEDASMTLALRIPPWAASVSVEGAARPVRRGRRVRIAARGNARLSLRFALRVRVLVLGGELRGKCALAYGPFIFALDKPPRGFTLSTTALAVDPRAPSVRVLRRNGRLLLRAPVARLPETVCAELPSRIQRAQADFVPVISAGIAGNPGVTRALSAEDVGFQFYEPKIPLPEYRVMLPLLSV